MRPQHLLGLLRERDRGDHAGELRGRELARWPPPCRVDHAARAARRPRRAWRRRAPPRSDSRTAPSPRRAPRACTSTPSFSAAASKRRSKACRRASRPVMEAKCNHESRRCHPPRLTALRPRPYGRARARAPVHQRRARRPARSRRARRSAPGTTPTPPAVPSRRRRAQRTPRPAPRPPPSAPRTRSVGSSACSKPSRPTRRAAGTRLPGAGAATRDSCLGSEPDASVRRRYHAQPGCRGWRSQRGIRGPRETLRSRSGSRRHEAAVRRTTRRVDSSRVPCLPRRLRRPRHAGRAYRERFSLASGPAPRCISGRPPSRASGATLGLAGVRGASLVQPAPWTARAPWASRSASRRPTREADARRRRRARRPHPRRAGRPATSSP